MIRKSFYEKAHRGEPCDERALVDHINSFHTVVLWGGGNLGRELGEVLLKKGVRISFYLDKSASSMQVVNGISVFESFTNVENKDESIIITCIANGSLGKDWTIEKLREIGFSNVLDGVALYEGVGCPLNRNYFNISECTGRNACSLCTANAIPVS